MLVLAACGSVLAWCFGVSSVLLEAAALVPDLDSLMCATCETDVGPPPPKWVPLAEMPAGAAAVFAAAHDWRFSAREPISVFEAVTLADAEWRRRIFDTPSSVRYCRSSLSLLLAAQAASIDARPGSLDTVVRILMARQLELQFNKSELLEITLNRHYFGQGAYGVEAASRTYFGAPASSLTKDQLVALTGHSGAHIRRLIEEPERLASQREYIDRIMNTGSTAE